ncbi:unnamed protein product [Heligmosomoides polygyrus]|uniref:CCHC-type domain-containing protein n=1 Tax=Heligmosomoides polygyrus TaxID=6339 RepID=A0A183GN00_HELPZ|nr:unnamed protein product [Heligmosomoides polygyrus]
MYTSMYEVLNISEMDYERQNVRRLKRQLKRLQAALPPLPSPQQLRKNFVNSSIQLMNTVETIELLKDDVKFFYNSQEPWGKLERNAQILELTVDKTRLQLLFLQHHLQTLCAVIRLLIANDSISKAAWEELISQPENYVSTSNKEKELPYQPELTERIIRDQINAIEELFASIREMKAECLNEERAQRECTQDQIFSALQSLNNNFHDVKSKLEAIKLPITSPPGEDRSSSRKQERDRIQANIDFMETPQVPEAPYIDLRAIENIEDRLNAAKDELTVQQKHFMSISRRRTCPTRNYGAEISRQQEREIRCVFCLAQGRHYSDLCDCIKNGRDRRLFLKEMKRCFICSELSCKQGVRCDKYDYQCHHCGARGHHPAICELPDQSKQLE